MCSGIFFFVLTTGVSAEVLLISRTFDGCEQRDRDRSPDEICTLLVSTIFETAERSPGGNRMELVFFL
jgi:hypothetical protein